jgi:hypothetical protein
VLELCSVLSHDATDVTNHVVEVVHHRIDGDSNNPNAAVRKDFCSEFVLLSLPWMMRPVDLHGQMNGGTIEVGDVYHARSHLAVLDRPFGPLAALLVGCILQYAPSSRLASKPIALVQFPQSVPARGIAGDDVLSAKFQSVQLAATQA